jgi:uncharacterized protein (TIGR02118 family)
MIRVLAFMRRLPDVSRDAFRAHYEEVHVPIALPFLTGTTGYVRQHVREELFGRTDFDCMTRFDYPDPATVRAVFERTEGPQADAIRRDERTFMDKPAIVFFPVEEGPVWEQTTTGARTAQLLVCVRRPEAESPASFRARFLDESLPALRTAVVAPRSARTQLALPGAAPGGGFDVVTEIEAEGAGQIARWAQALEAAGASVIAARVSLHETPMPG